MTCTSSENVNKTENYNYAVPIDLVNNLSTSEAEFLIKNQSFALFFKVNSISKDWKDKIQLPKQISELRKHAQKSYSSFMVGLFDELHKKYKNSYPPSSKYFKI